MVAAPAATSLPAEGAPPAPQEEIRMDAGSIVILIAVPILIIAAAIVGFLATGKGHDTARDQATDKVER
jgi:flagellar basal body-associated protein FliL